MILKKTIIVIILKTTKIEKIEKIERTPEKEKKILNRKKGKTTKNKNIP